MNLKHTTYTEILFISFKSLSHLIFQRFLSPFLRSCFFSLSPSYENAGNKRGILCFLTKSHKLHILPCVLAHTDNLMRDDYAQERKSTYVNLLSHTKRNLGATRAYKQ